jgi:hypothetical protein
MMFARNGTTPFVLDQIRLLLDQCGKLYFYGPLARKPYRRARDVAAFVKERFGIEYTERGMQALLRRKGYRYIKARLVPGKVDEDKQREQQEFIEGYFKLKAELGLKDRIYHSRCGTSHA